jgi:hypothetical protein
MDGGYYAIKGFEFQVDKTILEILKSETENSQINIEQIQDIDSDNFVMQVKYRETQEFIPSIIKKPVIQLLNEFKNNNKKTYYLYTFFKNLNGYEDFIDANKKITLKNLNQILGDKKEKFTEQEKQGFINNFILDFAPTFQNQFDEVIKKLKEEELGSNSEEVIFYYANITDFLRKLVINNPDSKNRSCTKKEIFDYIREGKKLIFNSSFREYKGDVAYYKSVKAKYFSFRNIDKFERFVIIELKGNESIIEIENAILKIKNIFYREGSMLRAVRGEAPYIYFLNIASDKMIQLKTKMLEAGLVFKDGYDFEGASFNKKTITEKSSKSNKICLKFINQEDELKEILKEDFGTRKELYQFFINEPFEIEDDFQHIKINIKEINDISQIL